MTDHGEDACDICGSRRFHIDAGYRYCANDHRQEGGPQAADDEEEYALFGKRTIRKKEKSRAKISRVYRGHKAYKLFLQAYQLIIWRQCYALTHEKGLPPELWSIVRDLWTLKLSKLTHRIEKPLNEDADIQGLSSGAESGGDSEQDAVDDASSRKRKPSSSPLLVDTVALCYLGMLLLRLPISLSDVYRWIREEDIPYVRAIRFVPKEMKEKLPGEYRRALDTNAILKADDLQMAIRQLIALYSRSFGISIPPVNTSPLLLEVMKKLALPLEVYPAVRRLNKIVNFTFAYSTSSKRQNAISQPEAQLMSLVIIAVKLIFPYDSDAVKRYPYSLNEPAAQRMDWAAWVEIRKTSNRLDTDGLLRKGEEVEVTDSDVFNMSNAQLDQYMDWYQRTWAKPSSEVAEDTNVGKEILDMFPLKSLPAREELQATAQDDELEQARLQMVSDVHSEIKIQRPISDEEAEQLGDTVISRPGMRYIRYRTIEELEGPAKTFYEAAAEVACLSVKSLVRAVMQTERKIMIWRNAKRRAERFGEEMNIEAEGGKVEEAEEWMQRMDLVGEPSEGEEGLEEEDEGVDDEDMEMIG